MTRLIPQVLRQAARAGRTISGSRTVSACCSCPAIVAPRVANTPLLPRIARRSYVASSTPNSAQVQSTPVENAAAPDPAIFGASDVDAELGHDDDPVTPIAQVLAGAARMEEGQRPIYLDMQATTPLDPRVLDAMLPYYVGIYGNPHSRTHAYGWESEKAVERAREHVASLIGADPKEIIFTSGATESNNMSIKGVARFLGKSGKKRHIITSQTEHKCVLDSCRYLQSEGHEVTYLPVQPNGIVDLDELKRAIRPETVMVSIMAVNNEIGVIQPLREIGEICRQNKIFFHSDAAQAVGKIPIDVDDMKIDLMSISSHKIYGPKGMGACYVRRRPRVRLEPIISGGGQERGLRSGTLAPALAVGFGEACRVAKAEMDVSSGRRSTDLLQSSLSRVSFLLMSLLCN